MTTARFDPAEPEHEKALGKLDGDFITEMFSTAIVFTPERLMAW
ncbi:hypothetical protein [Agromyces bauzanensis]